MENKTKDSNLTQTKEGESSKKEPVKTIIVEGFKPFGQTTVPTSREEIKRQLGFKKK